MLTLPASRDGTAATAVSELTLTTRSRLSNLQLFNGTCQSEPVT
ncbi:protein of unknown function (plasmid) [Caballeronia sp. S22]